MAAESEAAREGWVLALCNAGATLLVTPTELTDGGSVVGGSFSDAHEFASCSATQSKSQSAACLTTRAASAVSAVAAVKGSHSVSRLLVREGLSSGSWGAMPIGTGSSLSGLLISGRGIRSTLRKRPSKVHILHNLALEAPWVTRYFALLSAERMLVYVQHEPDAISEPQVRGRCARGRTDKRARTRVRACARGAAPAHLLRPLLRALWRRPPSLSRARCRACSR